MDWGGDKLRVCGEGNRCMLAGGQRGGIWNGSWAAIPQKLCGAARPAEPGAWVKVRRPKGDAGRRPHAARGGTGAAAGRAGLRAGFVSSAGVLGAKRPWVDLLRIATLRGSPLPSGTCS